MAVIRRATVEDIEALVNLRLRFLREVNTSGREPEDLEEATRAYLKRAIPAEAFIAWVAEQDGEIVATSGLCFYEIVPNWSNPGGRVGYILNMYTAPAHRGLGLAPALLTRLIEEARARGCGRLTLHATEAGMLVYRKLGFGEPGDEMTLSLLG